jgi:thiamine transport system permease protein
LFFLYPLASILGYSFARSAAPLSTLFEVLNSPSLRKVLWFTIWQAGLSTLFTLLVGLPGAYLMARYNFRGKGLLRILTGIPYVMPTIVVAIAFNALIGPHGWINLGLMRFLHLDNPPLELTQSIAAILIAHVFYNTTIVLRLVGDFWSHLDPRLGQAAHVLGASNWKIFREITFPLLMPAIAAAAALVFIFDFTSFGVILILGGPRFATLEVEIFYQTISLFNLPVAAVLSLFQLACTFLLTMIYTRLSARLARPLHIRPQTFTARRLAGWRSKAVGAAIIAFLVSFLILPLLGLGMRSIFRLEPERGQREVLQSGVTLDFYKELSTNRRKSIFFAPPATAIGLSSGYAAITVILSLALGAPAAWALARHGHSPINKVMEPLLMLPLGASAVTLGLGFIIALSHPPLDLRTSPILIPLAHTLVALPFVVNSLTPALRSIRPRLRHAASTLGAAPRQALFLIDLPLVGRALLTAATFAFTISLGEFGATALITRPEYPTIPVAIYRLISQPGAMNYGQALALSTILMLLCACGMLLIENMRLAEAGQF